MTTIINAHQTDASRPEADPRCDLSPTGHAGVPELDLHVFPRGELARRFDRPNRLFQLADLENDRGVGAAASGGRVHVRNVDMGVG